LAGHTFGGNTLALNILAGNILAGKKIGGKKIGRKLPSLLYLFALGHFCLTKVMDKLWLKVQNPVGY
jgi:hypothetical protein